MGRRALDKSGSDIDEWNQSTDFNALPERVGKGDDPVKREDEDLKTRSGALLKAMKKRGGNG
jgi:hypothetical protein